MALFVDGPVSTIDDLTNQDSGLLDVALTCGIDATTKLALAHEDLAADLRVWLDRPRPTLELMFGPVLHMEQIVATPPLKRWETMAALAMFYRDAYFSQLVDRYQARWDEYSKLSRESYERFVASGLGLVMNPVRKASLPLLSTTPGPQQGGTFYASVAWVNAAGQEGAASIAASIAVADGHLMTVTAVNAPAAVAGFNVYAGPALTGMVVQNDTPLAPGGSFTYVPGFTTQGRGPGAGQRPDVIRPMARILPRGQMAGTTGTLTNSVLTRLSSTPDGVNARIGAMEQADASLTAPGVRSIVALNANVDIGEKTGHAQYPALLVYCDKVSNSLKEKFRQFSGKAHLVVEVRCSQDRIEGLEASTQLYVDAVCALLDDSRGDWGNGSFYSGGYEVNYEAIGRGGKNFLHRARVGFEIEVSK
jgi:hypothetical protein